MKLPRIFPKRSAPANAPGGQKVISVEHVDGRTAAVTIGALSLKEAVAWVDLFEFDKRPEMIELCCRKPRGWADSLTIESAGDLVQHCYTIHLPRLITLAGRDVALGLRLMPLLERAIKARDIARKAKEVL